MWANLAARYSILFFSPIHYNCLIFSPSQWSITGTRPPYIYIMSYAAHEKLQDIKGNLRLFLGLTQKYCRLKPGIFVWEAPTSWRYVKNASMSSRPLIPSSRVDMTVFACSASSILVDCCSFVFKSRNFVNIFNNSAFSSNNLKAQGKYIMHNIVKRVNALIIHTC